MGVPKFYRWLSERYPKINQLISDASILPEFDNLYLDLNGIIHGCTHPNDDDLSGSLTEKEMMLGMFAYIERLVSTIIKPKKLLYLAVDGVAPRAKLNQQRFLFFLYFTLFYSFVHPCKQSSSVPISERS